MAQYLLSVWHDDDDELDFSSEDARRRVAQVGRFNADLETAGAWVFGAGLHPTSSATVVRTDGTDISTTDGPYADSKAHMGGFWIIDADDRDRALEWGRRAAAACEGPIEVRPLQGE